MRIKLSAQEQDWILKRRTSVAFNNGIDFCCDQLLLWQEKSSTGDNPAGTVFAKCEGKAFEAAAELLRGMKDKFS